jgi:predicted GTPase
MTSLAPAAERPAIPRRVLILGAAGRDFHNFNVVFRDDPTSVVIGFTASQIPGIAPWRYPSALAGARYPDGIPIDDEAALEALCRARRVDEVVFAYSDVPHKHVMDLASRALSVGADFVLLGPERTMLRASRPVIAITAVRTGCGKSQIARWLSRRLRGRGAHPRTMRSTCLRSKTMFKRTAMLLEPAYPALPRDAQPPPILIRDDADADPRRGPRRSCPRAPGAANAEKYAAA